MCVLCLGFYVLRTSIVGWMLYTVGKKIHCNKCFEFNFLSNNCTWKLLIKHLNGGKWWRNFKQEVANLMVVLQFWQQQWSNIFVISDKYVCTVILIRLFIRNASMAVETSLVITL